MHSLPDVLINTHLIIYEINDTAHTRLINRLSRFSPLMDNVNNKLSFCRENARCSRASLTHGVQ